MKTDDINDRNLAEAELRRSEELVRTIAENSTQGLAMMDERGYCTYANAAWLRMTGFTADEIGSAPLHDLVHHHYPDGRPYPMSECPIDRALPQNSDVRAHEDVFFRKDGSTFPVMCAASPIFKEGTPVATVVEIRDVTDAKRVEAELRQSEARALAAAEDAIAERRLLDAVFESAPLGIIVADSTGKLVRMNPGNERLWGVAPPSESVDEYVEWKGWWADNSARHGRRVQPHEWAMARALQGETVRDDMVEIEPFGAPGMRRTMLNSGAPVRDDDGQIVGAVVAQADISGLVSAEAALREKETLLKEIHHRVKNNLQVISSVLKLHAEQVQDPVALAAFQDSQDRVRSIALLHENLYQSKDLGRVDVEAYVRRLVHALLQTHGSRTAQVKIAIRIADVHLPIDMAVPCGLILNELVTNSLKHACRPEPATCAIDIDVHHEGDDIVLCVADDGVGLPEQFDPASARTLGVHLVQTLSRQIGGSVVFTSDGGTRCTVRFPLEAT